MVELKRTSTPTPKLIIPAGSDFTVPPPLKKQAIALVFGRAGEMKTSFALRGGPDPLAFFDIDKRGFHALDFARQEMKKRILYTSIDYPKSLVSLSDVEAKARAQKSWDKFAKNWEIALKESQKGNLRTLVIDTATELGEILKIAVTGRVDRVKNDYGASKGIINTTMAKILKMARDTPANVILLARAKEVWEDNKPSGIWQHEGLECLKYEADWAVHVRLKKSKTVKMSRKVKEFEFEFTKSGITIDELGEVYDADAWGDLGPFVWACVQAYPGTSPEDWM